MDIYMADIEISACSTPWTVLKQSLKEEQVLRGKQSSEFGWLRKEPIWLKCKMEREEDKARGTSQGQTIRPWGVKEKLILFLHINDSQNKPWRFYCCISLRTGCSYLQHQTQWLVKYMLLLMQKETQFGTY